MLLRRVFALGAFTLAASAQDDDPFRKYTISAEGINASFIAYGARLTNLFVSDRNGRPQDIALGYDDGAQYRRDDLTNHTFFGAVVGRVANRIRNGTFTIDGETYQIPNNEHGGLNPLHGGNVGYDQRNWTVVSSSENSVTFSFLDEAFEGFPGNVITHATYTVAARRLYTSMVSIPLDRATPILLSNHFYWNLDAFTSGANSTVLNDTLQMQYAKRRIGIDGILIPTGELVPTADTPFDFTSPKQIGRDFDDARACGTGCVGYDNAFILDRPRHSGPEDSTITQLSISSPNTGIQMDMRTNQQSIQIYTCGGQNGTIPVKESQQHGNGTSYVEQHGCIAIEPQQWIDGFNNPQWGQDEYQIYRPGGQPAINWAQYDFSVIA